MGIKSQSLTGRLAGNEAFLYTPVLSVIEWAAMSSEEYNAEMRDLSMVFLRFHVSEADTRVTSRFPLVTPGW